MIQSLDLAKNFLIYSIGLLIHRPKKASWDVLFSYCCFTAIAIKAYASVKRKTIK